MLMERDGNALWEADLESSYAAFKCVLERCRENRGSLCERAVCANTCVNYTSSHSGLLCDSGTVLTVCWLLKMNTF